VLASDGVRRAISIGIADGDGWICWQSCNPVAIGIPVPGPHGRDTVEDRVWVSSRKLMNIW